MGLDIQRINEWHYFQPKVKKPGLKILRTRSEMGFPKKSQKNLAIPIANSCLAL